MSITQDAVLNALSHVDDPDLKKDLVTLGMIQNLRIEGQHVAFKVVLTTPSCPMKDSIQKACVTAIHTLVDSEADVEAEMTSNVTTAKDEGSQLPGVRNIIAIGSGKGGVGKSSVAANLAIALQRDGARVGVLDADIYGPSIPTLFGVGDEQPAITEVNGRNVMQPIERHGLKLNSIGMLVPPGQAVVWRGPMASKALQQLFNDTDWGELDYLIVDLPPGTGDIQITITQTYPITGAIIVTTPQEVALSDVRKAVAMLIAPNINVPVLGLVENMAYFTPPDLPDRRYYLFGQGGGESLAEEYNLEMLGQVPILGEMQEGSDNGQPAALEAGPVETAFRDIAGKTAQQVAIRNAMGARQPAGAGG